MLVDGRCPLMSLCSNSFGLYKRVHILNLHNYGLTGGQVSCIGSELDKQIRDSSTRPNEECGIILGDFNFLSGDDRVFKVGSSLSGASTTSTSASSGSHRTAWMIFLSWTELVQPFPTHLDSKGNSLSRLDRAFFSCPSSLILKLHIGWSVSDNPKSGVLSLRVITSSCCVFW